MVMITKIQRQVPQLYEYRQLTKLHRPEVDTKTAAKPPNATNPIIPTLKSPAKPHCKLTLRDIIALINPIFKISNAVFQL